MAASQNGGSEHLSIPLARFGALWRLRAIYTFAERNPVRIDDLDVQLQMESFIYAMTDTSGEPPRRDW